MLNGDQEEFGPEQGIDVGLKREKLPEQLKDSHEQLQDILIHTEIPDEDTLFENMSYPHADQVEQIAEVLMDEIGTHLPLRHRSIKYVFRKSLSDRGQPALGKGSKVGTKLRELSGYEFLVQIHHQPYMQLPAHRKIRTIDHELCHLSLDQDDEPETRFHDIEEFTEVARRWGLKPGNQVKFGETIQQTDLFQEEEDDFVQESEAVPA